MILDELKARLRAEPQKYDQARFGPRAAAFDDSGRGGHCKTPCCIAGHLFMMIHPEQSLRDVLACVETSTEMDGCTIVTHTAAEALGIPPVGWKASFLFGTGNCWPEKFRPSACGLTAEDAEKACGMLDYVLNPDLTFETYQEDRLQEYRDSRAVGDREQAI